ncbi:MAG: Gldg family protein [Faecalibacterium sp.]
MKKFSLKKCFSSPAPLDGGRVFRSGVYSTAILAAAVVLAVLVNLVVRAIPSKYTEFDLSEAGLYTLGDTSLELVRGLEQDVTIYYLCETGSEDAILTKLLDRYAAESAHLRWEQKDPAIYPTFAAQYGAQNSSAGSLILTAGENSAVLDGAELYEYDYSDYYYTGTYSVTFGGENKITAAIYRLTSGEASHAYYTTGHGEQALTASLIDALEAQNIEAASLDLLSSTIPEDCGLLIINCPASDFAGAGSLVDEMGQLRAYLKAGGKLLVTTDAYYSTPNLDALLAEFGLTRTEGLVVEGDMDHALYGYLYYLLPDYSYTEESTALDGIDASRRVLLQMAQGITLTEVDGVFAEPLLTTSAEAYSKVTGYEMTTVEKESGDLDGPFALAAYAIDQDTGAEVIWIGCGNMDNEMVYESVPGNKTFLQGCAASLSGQSSSILIESKSLEAEPITVSSAAASALGLVVVIVIPALVLAAGAVVVLLRRRR